MQNSRAIVEKGSIALDNSKLPLVDDFPPPKSSKELQAFLGLTNYFRRYIPLYARLAAPLEILRNRRTFQLSDTSLKAFQNLKASLRSAPILHLPDFTRPFILACDASTSGFGAVLFQIEEYQDQLAATEINARPRRIIELIARALTAAERNYRIHLLELTAVAWSLAKLKHILLGQRVIVLSAPCSLTLSKEPAPRVTRYWETLLNFGLSIRYLKGV